MEKSPRHRFVERSGITTQEHNVGSRPTSDLRDPIVGSATYHLTTVHSLNRDVAQFLVVEPGSIMGPAGRKIFASPDLHDDRSDTELPALLVRPLTPQQQSPDVFHSSKSRLKRHRALPKVISMAEHPPHDGVRLFEHVRCPSQESNRPGTSMTLVFSGRLSY